MLGLTLRKEFQGKRLRGTAIELANEKNTGATQVPARDFLEITYPTGDVLKSIEAISPNQGRPLVLIGERGQGKSHLLGVLFHALADDATTKNWLEAWAARLGNPKIAKLQLRSQMHVISESLHRQRYKFLWDLLFDSHPEGKFIRGKWEGMGEKKTDIPPDYLILEMLRKNPTALLLDEFQTWYDGLTNTKQYPWRNWAFNFIQVLSEIAKEHPELLVLVVSVRNGNSDAYQQIHRVNPIPVDFKGPNADRDRRRLLLHRLFENRDQVPAADIQNVIQVHVSEYFRLEETAPAEQERKSREFVEMWPFAPHLMQLLEDQVLVATDAQETRDLIRILADLFKSRGEATPILKAADFRLDDDSSGIVALLDSVANQHHAALREKAQRNLSSVQEALPDYAVTVPHLQSAVGALWLRSLATANLAGATPRTLQVDITADRPIDDNAFRVELSSIVDNSFNIHPDGDRLVFREEENPQAKLMTYARNDRLFTDGLDHLQLAREIRYVIGGTEEIARSFQVVVLPREWASDPWKGLEDPEKPEYWDERLPIVVIPEDLDQIDSRLGKWLKDNLQKRRNTIRFLLPRTGSGNAYADRDLIIYARAVLKAQEWRTQTPEYGKLHTKFQTELRNLIKSRFDRFAVLKTWNFVDPNKCKFQVEALKVQGNKIPEAIEEAVKGDLFVPEDFEPLVLAAAQENKSVGQLLEELKEPRPNEEDCIPWLGETLMKERIIRLCARGRIAINLRGMEYLQAMPGEDEDAAWKRMRGRLGTGKHLDETYVLLPQAVPAAYGFGNVPGISIPPARGGLFPPTPVPTGGASGTPAASTNATPVVTPSETADIFGGGSGQYVPLHAPPTSALNLQARVEGWGIRPGTGVQEISLKVAKATGAQLNELLRKLPDGLTYELDLKKEENQ
ncbi:MAG TPA: DUF499 domain-containing protein [Terriglobia bacterium]|nr:DUF499 domain-containing protein [Terriglobia bacterium]